MKKLFLSLGIVLPTYQCTTTEQSKLPDHYKHDKNNIELQVPSTKLERINDTLFIMENETCFAVNPNVVTVKLKPGINKIEQKVRELRSNRLGYIDIQVPKGFDVEEYVSLLEKSGEFSLVEYNAFWEWCYLPNDSQISNQWYLNAINATSAWDITTGSPSVHVAVIDSGIQWQHPDLGNVSDGGNIDVSLGWNYITNNNDVSATNNEHGTLIAGIIAAKTNNGLGIAGIAGGKNSRGITIIPYCIGDADGVHSEFLDDAIIDAVDKGVRVIQLSLKGPSTPAVSDAIHYAMINDVIVVCAAGNHGTATNIGGPVFYPASISTVIAVGATTQNNTRADFSNYGSGLDVVAPGVNIWSTTFNGSYIGTGGTSFAAPQVSAIAALILSKYPHFTRLQVENIITSTASNSVWDNQTGYGVVNAHKALFGDLVISGPDRPAPNTSVQYSVPAQLIVTFTGWTITPSSYTTTGGTNENTLYITFTAPGQYTLTANYTLPGNTPYSITKTVAAAVTLPPLPPKPSIDGSGQSWVQVRTTYSVPEPPDTVTFTGWTISPADYTATGGLNNLELNVKFTATTQYTLQANFSMPDGRTYSSNTKTVTVDPLPALPTISGPAETAWNADVTYSYKPPWSTGPPPPLTFSNWSITPNDYRTPNGTTNHTLDIRFGAADQYIVKANFSLPDGSSLSSTKTVIVKKFSAPIIAYNYENGEPAGPALWTAKAYVFNVQTQVDYEWSINGNLVYSSPTFPTSIYLPAFNSNDRFVVSCRARMGAAASNWSNTLTVTAP